jgi:hypothetical protein
MLVRHSDAKPIPGYSLGVWNMLNRILCAVLSLALVVGFSAAEVNAAPAKGKAAPAAKGAEAKAAKGGKKGGKKGAKKGGKKGGKKGAGKKTEA